MLAFPSHVHRALANLTLIKFYPLETYSGLECDVELGGQSARLTLLSTTDHCIAATYGSTISKKLKIVTSSW